MGGCCYTKSHKKKQKIDYLLWGSITIVAIFYVWELFFSNLWWIFSQSVFELLNKMWLWIGLGILFVWILDKIPREFIMSILWKPGTFSWIFRATWAWVLLDLCSHGILMVGMKLYERWASLWQVMAFLIASPWNSLSLTLILWVLIGFKLTFLFLILSMIIAIISWFIFEKLVGNQVLPKNPNHTDIREDFHFMTEAKKNLKTLKIDRLFFASLIWKWFRWSRMVLKWIFFWVILASLIRTFISPEHFQTFFGPTIAWLWLTVLVATILEVCSEWSTPIAADIATRAGASWNSFAFLMTGVSTDYTEILSLKETTKSWKIAFFLPLVTLPQVLFIAILLNNTF